MASFHFVCHRIYGADISPHHSRRTRAEMADDSETIAGGAGYGHSAALVLPGVLSVQSAAESRGALAPETHRHRTRRHGRPHANGGGTAPRARGGAAGR